MTKEELKQEIKELKQQLKESKQHTYIHETHHLYCQDGELHIHYGDVENDNWLVWNTDSLYKDLHFIINQVVKENKKMQQMYLNNIKEELKDI